MSRISLNFPQQKSRTLTAISLPSIENFLHQGFGYDTHHHRLLSKLLAIMGLDVLLLFFKMSLDAAF
jgi:hypothetical protein